MDSNILTSKHLTTNKLTCNVFFISCSPLLGFYDLIVACALLCGMDVFECGRTVLWAMLCIVSWSQGLVMAKDLCEVTITKRLAWLVEQLVVSSHEFSFILFWKLFSNSFIIFSINVFTTFLVHLCSIFILFSKPLLFCFYIAAFIAFSTYHFWIFFSFLFLILLTKKTC